jgi:hypothetical protein
MFSKIRLSLALMVNVIVILEIDPQKIDEFLRHPRKRRRLASGARLPAL